MKWAFRRWRRWVLLLAAAGLLAWLIVPSARRVKEPVYQGKPLHQWLDSINEVDLVFRGTNGLCLAETNAGIAAVLNLGEQALPWLKSELAVDQSAWRDRLMKVMKRVPSQIGGRWFYSNLARQEFPLIVRHRRAAVAALILGGAAKPLASELDRRGSWQYGPGVVGLAWARMGTNGLLPMVHSLTNQNSMVQMEALLGMPYLLAGLRPGREDLVYALTNSGGYLKVQQALVEAGGPSNVINPIIIGGLPATDRVRISQVHPGFWMILPSGPPPPPPNSSSGSSSGQSLPAVHIP